MPIYEYICPSCQYKFERVRPFRQASEAVSCPKCHGEARRVFSSFAYNFKDMNEWPSSARKT